MKTSEDLRKKGADAIIYSINMSLNGPPIGCSDEKWESLRERVMAYAYQCAKAADLFEQEIKPADLWGQIPYY